MNKVLFNPAYMPLVDGNVTDCLVLTQLHDYWMPRRSIERDGELWVVKAYSDFAAEFGMTLNQIKKSVARLKQKGLVKASVHFFQKVRHVFIQTIAEKVGFSTPTKVPNGTQQVKGEFPTELNDESKVPIGTQQSEVKCQTALNTPTKVPMGTLKNRDSITETLLLTENTTTNKDGLVVVDADLPEKIRLVELAGLSMSSRLRNALKERELSWVKDLLAYAKASSKSLRNPRAFVAKAIHEGEYAQFENKPKPKTNGLTDWAWKVKEEFPESLEEYHRMLRLPGWDGESVYEFIKGYQMPVEEVGA